MGKEIKKVSSQSLKEWWGSHNRPAKVLFVAFAAACVCGTVFYVFSIKEAVQDYKCSKDERCRNAQYSNMSKDSATQFAHEIARKFEEMTREENDCNRSSICREELSRLKTANHLSPATLGQ